MPGSHSLLFELSLPVISQQLRLSIAILAANGGFRRDPGVSSAEFEAGSDDQSGADMVELAESLRSPCRASPLFNRSGFCGPGSFEPTAPSA
jgi:hypothetical protein